MQSHTLQYAFNDVRLPKLAKTLFTTATDSLFYVCGPYALVRVLAHHLSSEQDTLDVICDLHLAVATLDSFTYHFPRLNGCFNGTTEHPSKSNKRLQYLGDFR